jgi:hypothetical protein
MKYYSTNHQASDASLEEAVVKGLASDKGLYMPDTIKPLPQEFYDQIENLSFQEIAYRVADAFFGEDVPAKTHCLSHLPVWLQNASVCFHPPAFDGVIQNPYPGKVLSSKYLTSTSASSVVICPAE